jgi:flagellar hook-length control protein FliK
MRNLFAAGVGLESLARPKAKEFAPAGNFSFKGRGVADFRAMLHTACAVKTPDRNQVQNGKPLKMDPKSPSLVKKRPVAKDKKEATALTEKRVAQPLGVQHDALPDEIRDVPGQPDAVAASSEIVTGMPLNDAQMLSAEAVAGVVSTGNLPMATVADLSATPSPTPTPTATTPAPKTESTCLQPSRVAAQLDGMAPVNSETGNGVLPVMTTDGQTITPSLATVPQAAVAPPVTSALLNEANLPAPLVEVVGSGAPGGELTQTTGPVKTVNPQAGKTLQQTAVQAEVPAVTAAVDLTTAVAPATLMTPTPGAGACQSQVQTGSGAEITVASVPTFSVNTPEVASPVAANQAGQPVQTIEPPVPVNTAGLALSQSGMIGSSLILPTDAVQTAKMSSAVTTDLNRAVNYNTVMAGTSLQKNGIASNSVLQQPGGESASALQALSVPVGMVFNSGNRLTKTKQDTPDSDRGLTDQRGAAPTETVVQDQKSTGVGMLGVRKNSAHNLSDAPTNLQASSTNESAKAVTQAGLNLGLASKTAGATDEPKQAVAAKLLSETETVDKAGKTAPELPAAGAVAAQDNVVQISHAVDQKEVPAVNKDELFTQIVDQAKVMVNQGQSEMELSLKPDHLGKLKLKIAIENQVVTAHFTVESEQVKQVIETNLVQLRKLLQDTGAQVENLTVSVGQHNMNANYSQQSNSGGQGDRPQQQPQTAFANAKEMTRQPEEIREPAKSKALIDLIA